MSHQPHIAVIGAGFSGLSAACSLAARGYTVTIFEKNSTAGGRARVFETDGFRFDMGPSWYWMPDVFEEFFSHFGHSVSDHYSLLRLDPAFRIVFPGEETLDIPGHFEALVTLFEQIEPVAGDKLRRFMDEAKLKYDLGVKCLAFKPGRSLFEYCDWQLLRNLHRLNLFTRFDVYVKRFFRDERLRRVMEFPILFLGARPQSIPALYSFMNYGGLFAGTWYPKGGIGVVVNALTELARSLGVRIELNAPVESIAIENGGVLGLKVKGAFIQAAGVVAAADYAHVDQGLLPDSHREYSSSYWNSRKLAPSALIFYLGLNRQIPRLLHHNLFFDTNFDEHTDALFLKPQWPKNPLFYCSAPSKTDETVAPHGYENLFILVPLASGLNDIEEERERIFENVITRLSRYTSIPLKNHLVVKRTYCLNDFVSDYNALHGNAYGLANTLRQTATGKPRIVSSRVERLVYAGQLTVPGPGVPPSLISGRIAASELERSMRQ